MVTPDPMSDDEFDARQRSSLLAIRRRKRRAMAGLRRAPPGHIPPRVPPDGDSTRVDRREDEALDEWAEIAAGIRRGRGVDVVHSDSDPEGPR